MEWQPIETVPKDGTRVLLFSYDSYERISIGHWGTSEPDFSGKTCWVTDSEGPGYNSDIDNPSHWMPLPKEPK